MIEVGTVAALAVVATDTSVLDKLLKGGNPINSSKVTLGKFVDLQ